MTSCSMQPHSSVEKLSNQNEIEKVSLQVGEGSFPLPLKINGGFYIWSVKNPHYQDSLTQ